MDFMNRPEEYAAAAALPYVATGETANEFSEELKTMNGKIIDIGCGPAHVTHRVLLPSVAPEAVIVGGDISQAMLDYARSQYKDEKRLSFIEMDIQAEELPEHLIEQFDNVLSSYCFQWCPNRKLTAKNMYKLLRPGGRGFTVFVSNHYLFELLCHWQKDSDYAVYMKDLVNWSCPYQCFNNPEEIFQKDLEEVGFKVLHCSNRWRIWTWKNVQNMMDFYTTVNPFMDKIPDALQEKFRNDICKSFVDKFSSNEERKNVDNYVINDRYSTIVAYFEKPINE